MGAVSIVTKDELHPRGNLPQISLIKCKKFMWYKSDNTTLILSLHYQTHYPTVRTNHETINK